MSEMSRELLNKNQPRPETFRELICAMDQALKARAKQLEIWKSNFRQASFMAIITGNPPPKTANENFTVNLPIKPLFCGVFLFSLLG